MIIKSANESRIVSVGSSDYFFSLYSTIRIRLDSFKNQISMVLNFFDSGICHHKDCIETARQLNLVRDMLSSVAVKDLVYDMNDPKKKAPWEDNISPVVTSCGNLFTTSDGKDMLYEIVSILTYGFYSENDVIIG